MAAERSIKIIYWNTTGRAHAMRLALDIGGVPYEDEFIEDWGEMKPKTPWGSVPLMVCDGVEVGQTRAILRLCGKLSGLYPEEAVKAAQVDAIIDVLEEVLVGMFAEDKDAKFAEDGAMGIRLKQLVKFLSTTGNGKYAVGDSLTLADVAIFSYLNLTSCWFPSINTWKLCPTLLDIRETVENIPAVQAHLADETRSNEKYDYSRRSTQSIREELFPVKLTYWHGFGRAERVRMTLALSGIAFEDIGLTGPEKYEELKATKLKYGQLPLVEIDGKNLAQTGAMMRYIARKGDIYGDTDDERYEIDNVCDACCDFYDPAMMLLFSGSEEAMEGIRQKLLTTSIPKYLGIFENQISNSGSGWLVGSRPSMADGFLFSALRYMSIDEVLGNLDFLNDYPCVQAMYANFGALPQVAAQLEKEVKIEIPEYVKVVRATLNWY